MFTVDQLRADIAEYTLDAGKCKDSKYVLEYINKARRLLWPRGDFAGTLDTLCVQSCDGLLTLPIDYLRIKDVMQSRGFVAIDNEWYEYADNVRFSNTCTSQIIDLGDKFASFRDYSVVHRLAIKAESNLDKGKKVNFNAIGENGDRLSLVFTIGEDHELVTLDPYIKHFRHASKDVTEGRIRVYIHDPNKDKKIICAYYEPDDTAIQLRRYRVPSRDANTQYYVRCKKRYRELRNETDPVEFSTDALIQACIAITARRNKKLDEFTAAMNLAVEHENKALGTDKENTGGQNLLPEV
jgi:hypothetical protein